MTAARPDPGPDGLIVDHELRIETRWLQAILVGDKRCEVRFNDRGYAVGDVLALSDGDASLLALVTHVLTHRDIADRIDWRIFDLQDDGHTVVIGRWPSSFGDDGRIQPLVGGLSHSEMRLLLSWYVVDHKIKAQWLGLRSWAYYRALHASVHDRKPFSCQATPARWSGGYSHWHCRLRRRHTGPHRVGAYTWSGQGCVIYDGERAS